MPIWSGSHQSHVSHLSPSLVVAVWSIWVLVVVGGLHGQLWVIWVMSVELELTLEGGGVLTVDLVGQGPEDSLPNEGGLGVLESQVVLVVTVGRTDIEVEVSDVEPETDCDETSNDRPNLEPTLRVDVIESEVRVTLEWSPDWEAVGCVLLGEHTKGVDHVWQLKGHLGQDVLLGVVVLGIGDTLLQSEVLVVVLANGTGCPFAHPLGTIPPIIGPQ